MASLRDYFDRTYVISLPWRKDRRSAVTRELAPIGLPLEAGKVVFFDAIRPEQDEGFPGIGAYGCFLSHLAVLRRAREEGLGRVLILEDDLEFSPKLVAAQSELCRQLASRPWAFAWLGHTLPDEASGGSSTRGVGDVELRPYAEGLVTSHFYAVDRAVLDDLIAYLEQLLVRPPGHPEGGPMHVDGAFSMFRERNPGYLTLVARPSLGRQRSSRSDVADQRWFDRIRGLRVLTALARDIKSRRFL